MSRNTALAMALSAALAAAAAVAQTPSPSPGAPPARPCLTSAEHRAFDFWVGEWDVRGVKAAPGAPPSRSRIEKVEDGCVISEVYTTPAGYSGRSLNAYDPETKRWHQFWADNAGGIHRYVGQARGGNVYYEAEGVPVPGMSKPARVKMTFFAQPDGRVRQLGEASTDGGATWTTMYDLTYTRRSAP